MMQRPSRPVGITILAMLEILIGIVGLLASLVIIGFSALFSTLPTVGSLLGAIGLVIGGVVLFFGVIWLATGVGFLHGRGWSWTLGMIFSALSLLGAIGALTIGLVTGGVGGSIFWGLMLYYLTRTHVKAFFGKGGLLITPAYMVPYSLGPQGNQPQIATNADYGRASAVGPQVTFPPISQGSSASIPGPSPVSSTPASSGSSSGGKAPVCPYCHSTLPMGTKKCLTCGAAI
ncbi:hypothetical protein E6H17_03270 [Candidatus Bathyarchaeota archaeon]|nr:MAG: hypothetical protein E6H17_03270 [Candidatus Bathyarchaeota archaeon]TMI71436.1 MAG: hypothetical protein E6H11_04110 [Candidatus Bathyarchaeota archaeon]